MLPPPVHQHWTHDNLKWRLKLNSQRHPDPSIHRRKKSKSSLASGQCRNVTAVSSWSAGGSNAALLLRKREEDGRGESSITNQPTNSTVQKLQMFKLEDCRSGQNRSWHICEHWTWCDGVEGVRASLVRTADKIAACLCRKCFQAAVSIRQWPTLQQWGCHVCVWHHRMSCWRSRSETRKIASFSLGGDTHSLLTHSHVVETPILTAATHCEAVAGMWSEIQSASQHSSGLTFCQWFFCDIDK